MDVFKGKNMIDFGKKFYMMMLVSNIYQK